MTTSTFWFQSFQNWQSEFLAVGSLVVLSIFLRQRGSPESKPVAAPHRQTGELSRQTSRRPGSEPVSRSWTRLHPAGVRA